MNYRIAVLFVFVGIAIVSFCIGQGKQAVKSQVTSDVKMSDHDKTEKLLVEVAELQKKLAALTQKYDTHTHQLRNLEVAQLPGSIECNQTVVQWAPTDMYRGSVDKVCRQLMSNNTSVLVPGKESIVTGPPRP
jgi:spore coat protein CotF